MNGSVSAFEQGLEVAQVSNLLYRRFPIGSAWLVRMRPEMSHGSLAGSPAIQQVGNLRYVKTAMLPS